MTIGTALRDIPGLASGKVVIRLVLGTFVIEQEKIDGAMSHRAIHTCIYVSQSRAASLLRFTVKARFHMKLYLYLCLEHTETPGKCTD